MITSVLVDLGFILGLLCAGILCGAIGSNIIYHARLRRIRMDTWREASRHYAARLNQTLTRL